MIISNKSEKGKIVITYQCDHCKEQITAGDSIFLSARKFGNGTIWDICLSCLDKLKLVLGEGRKLDPSPHFTGRKL